MDIKKGKITKDSTFDKILNLQTLIKKEASLKELCTFKRIIIII